MTALVEGAKRLVGRGSPGLAERVDGLEAAVAAARGRLDAEVVDEASGVAARARARLRLSGEHTVVALAGATGSGKSSTFNALCGLDLAAVGVRRPTTSWTTACVWGAEGAGELLEWLGVPKRHQISHASALDSSALDSKGGGGELQGLVLLDLPDHDSTEATHRVEVDRLVRLVDLLVWVLDPQKYADEAIHGRYLRPLATHREIMLVVLNHIDVVAPEQRAAMLDDVRRRLREDGLDGVPVIATSARHGAGIPELSRAVADRVAAKKAARARLLADIKSAAGRMSLESGSASPRELTRAGRAELVDSFADAAGVPTVVRAVERATRARARQATGWPVTAWAGRLRPDPLRRLHLDLGGAGKELTARARASIPQASQVQRARVDTAVRAAADDASAGLARPWVAAVRRASGSRLSDLSDSLDRAVAGTDLGVARTPVWWRVVRVLQWVLLFAAIVGGLWLAGLAVLGYLQLEAPEGPDYRGLPLPTILLVGGVAAGVVLALLCRLLTRVSARSRARSADRRLREAVGEVTEDLVIEPIEAELEAYRAVRDGLAAALR